MQTASATVPGAASSPPHQRFCDVKRALNDTLTASLVPQALPELVSSMGCTGLRVPLLPTLRSPSLYPAAFNATLVWAREAGLSVYASPMEGAWKASDSSESLYAAWVAGAAHAFQPNFLSVFNEVGAQACDGECMERTVVAVRRELQQLQQRGSAQQQPPPLPLFVGPDAEHVSESIALVSSRSQHLGVFDILSSHNAGGDTSNTKEQWALLAKLAAGRDVWSSENPTCFHLQQCSTEYGSMAVALESNMSAIVGWNTLGDDVTLNGTVTAKGADIAAGW